MKILDSNFEGNAKIVLRGTEYGYKFNYTSDGKMSMISTGTELVPDITATTDGCYYYYDGIKYETPYDVSSPASIFSKALTDMKGKYITPDFAGEYVYYGNAIETDYKAYFLKNGQLLRFTTNNFEIVIK